MKGDLFWFGVGVLVTAAALLGFATAAVLDNPVQAALCAASAIFYGFITRSRAKRIVRRAVQ